MSEKILGWDLSCLLTVLFPFPLLNGKYHNIVTNELRKLKVDFNLKQTDINLRKSYFETSHGPSTAAKRLKF